jgi:PHD/YefM family antitoxin component YafN of YafNO toxin-antitoxin module
VASRFVPGDRVVITRAGKPVAVLIDRARFEALARLDADFARLTDAWGSADRGTEEAVAPAHASRCP